MRLASAAGTAALALVGHPHAATLDLLGRMRPELAAEGIELVPLTTLLGVERAAEESR